MLVLALTGGSAGAQGMERAGVAGLAHSERLRLYSLTRSLDRHASPRLTRAARQMLVAQAFYHDARRPAVIGTHISLSPTLSWDGNINGGFLNDRFEHFGLVFELDPAHRARAGLVAGANLGAEMRLAYGQGRFLELQGRGEAVWSPRHEIGRASASLSVCSRNHVTGWTFADLCASSQGSWRALSNSRSAVLSGTLSHLFTLGPGHHQVSATMARHWQPEGRQEALTLGWGTVWSRVATDLSFTWSDGIRDENALRRRLGAQVSWLWGGRPLSLSVWQITAGGGRLLGVDRRDRLTGVSLSVRPHPRLTVDITHQQTRSTHTLFQESRTGLGVRFNLAR